MGLRTLGLGRWPLAIFACLCALVLSGTLGSAAWARIEVEDSPLFGRVLDEANADLRDVTVASTPWSGQAVAANLGDLVFGSPARADGPNVTTKGELTKCSNNKITQCDTGSDGKQKCTKTTQAEKKTQCNGPLDKTFCKDNSKTRCPNGTNECLTMVASQKTACKPSQNKPTLCDKETTVCNAAEENTCKTTGPDAKTFCRDGSEHVTLCKDVKTGCTPQGKNMCKTSKANGVTFCTNEEPRITFCQGVATTCTGDQPDPVCPLTRVSMVPENGDSPSVLYDTQKLLTVHTEPGFFGPGSEPFTGLQFIPPGPQVLDVTIYDDQEAHFLVSLPNPPSGLQSYEVMVYSGANNAMTTGLLVDMTPVPASAPAGVVALAAALILAGTWLLVRRRNEEEHAA